MAVLQIAPRDEVFERVEALTLVARIVLDVRIVCGLLVAVWLVTGPRDGLVLLGVCGMMAWLLLVLLRWRTIGWLLCTHPAVLAVDTAFGFVVLARTEAVSPALVLVAGGAMLTGLCLDRRGAGFFSPLLVGGWWLLRVEPARAHRRRRRIRPYRRDAGAAGRTALPRRGHP
jgi:hypothetical protein